VVFFSRYRIPDNKPGRGRRLVADVLSGSLETALRTQGILVATM